LGKQLKGLRCTPAQQLWGWPYRPHLDVLGIGERTGVFGELQEQARSVDKQKAQAEIEQRRLLLSGRLIRTPGDSTFSCRTARRVSVSAIEHASGGQVIQYRGQIPIPGVFCGMCWNPTRHAATYRLILCKWSYSRWRPQCGNDG